MRPYYVIFKTRGGNTKSLPFSKLKSEARPFAQKMHNQGRLVSLTNAKGTRISL